MTTFSEARKIAQHLKKFEAEIDSMVNTMGVMAKNHFTANFRKQGFDDENIVKWKKRKKKESRRGKVGESGVASVGMGRNILVKSGRLRRSINFRKKGKWAVVIGTDVPYAKIHNEGGTINKSFDRKILSFSSGGKFAKTRTRAQRKEVSYQQQVTINAHTIKMPKRQFIGYSGKLNRQIISSFSNKIKRIFA